jgi:hypothetical protein
MTEEGIKRGREAALIAATEVHYGSRVEQRDIANAAIDAFLAELGKTHVVAPREPTEAMLASEDARVWVIEPDEFKAQCLHRIWNAMFAARPSVGR